MLRAKRLVVVAQFVPEQRVDEAQNRGLAAKVERQCLAAGGGSFVAEPTKDMRVGPAKAVDRLLVVADEKQFAVGQLPAAQGLDELDLQRIGVLKLVNQQQV